MGAVVTRPLAELRRSDASAFGGKSANLGDMLAAGIPVPQGFAIGVDAYRAFVAEAALEGAIAAASERARGGDVETVAAASTSVGRAVRSAPLPAEVRTEVAARYAELARAAGDEQPPVAVRSSALGEDSAEASYAGQQESFLWVRGAQRVCEAVRECWASLHSPPAMSYRAAVRGDETPPAMGVTVQLMVDAEVSGVMFTCNPVSGDPSMVAVNASWGLGLAVVGGELTPDDYLLSKVTGEVVRQTVGRKQVEYVPDETGEGAVRRDVPSGRQELPCLDAEDLAALLDVARTVEGHFGGHQDIEWATARGQALPASLVVLQARPVTTMGRRSPKPAASVMSLVLGTFGAPSDPPADS